MIAKLKFYLHKLKYFIFNLQPWYCPEYDTELVLGFEYSGQLICPNKKCNWGK